jgi:hypothetical protein
MRMRFALAVAGVCALSPLTVLASAGSPANAMVAHPAAAARSAVAEANCGFEPGNEFGGLGTTALTAGYEVWVANPGETMTTSTWCEDLDGVRSGWELLRMEGTSLCAQYEGGPGGGDGTWLELAACDSNKTAQLWSTKTDVDQVVYNDYAGPDACLTSNNPANSPAGTPAFLVPVSGGCGNGKGGQVWKLFPEPPNPAE